MIVRYVVMLVVSLTSKTMYCKVLD